MVEVVPAEQVPFALIQPNPYITGGAVDTPAMFFGRQDVLDFLSANLIGKHQSNVIILQGNRRTGKSSILKQVVNRDLFAPHIPVYVDCQGLGTLTNQSFFYKLAREIWKSLAKRGDVAAPPRVSRDDFSEDDPFYDFQEVLDQLVTLMPGHRIILLVDEFEVIDAAIQRGDLDVIVLENLRHLFQHRHDLAVVLTGSYRLTRLSQEYWSILFGVGLKHEVGFLDENAVRQLITEPLWGIVTYSDQAVSRIVQLTACQPYFVQMVCHDVVNVLNRHETTYVTQLEVEEAAQETLISADGHMRFMFELADSRAQQAVLVYMASSLSQPGTLAGHAIEEFVASSRLPMSHAELEDALRELADRDVVQIEGTMGQRRYGFKIDLFCQWVRRNYDLQSAIALAQSASYIREGK
jgi:type I restriction enzyme M protein